MLRYFNFSVNINNVQSVERQNRENVSHENLITNLCTTIRLDIQTLRKNMTSSRFNFINIKIFMF